MQILKNIITDLVPEEKEEQAINFLEKRLDFLFNEWELEKIEEIKERRK